MKDITPESIVTLELTPREIHVIAMCLSSTSAEQQNVPYPEFSDVELAFCRLSDKYYKPKDDI